MPFSSNGVFTRVYSWAADKLNGIKIRADRMDGEMDNFASGLSACMLRDGTGKPTANIDFNAKKATNLAAGTDPTDAIRKGEAEALVTAEANARAAADAALTTNVAAAQSAANGAQNTANSAATAAANAQSTANNAGNVASNAQTTASGAQSTANTAQATAAAASAKLPAITEVLQFWRQYTIPAGISSLSSGSLGQMPTYAGSSSNDVVLADYAGNIGGGTAGVATYHSFSVNFNGSISFQNLSPTTTSGSVSVPILFTVYKRSAATPQV